MQLSEDIRKKVISFQQTEITEYHIYKRLANRIKSEENAKILNQIAEDELRHYKGWKEYTKEEIQPRWFFVWFYYLVSIAFGFTFGVKLMEMGEQAAQKNYADVARVIPEAATYQHEEDKHEKQLIDMLDEVGSIKDEYKKAWLTENMPYRLNTILSRFDVESAMWQKLLLKVLDFQVQHPVNFIPDQTFEQIFKPDY